MDQALWDQTVAVATTQIPELTGVSIPASSFTAEHAEAAVTALNDDGLDTSGSSWQKLTDVKLNQGGE